MELFLAIAKGILAVCSDGVLVLFVGLYAIFLVVSLKALIFDREPFPKELFLHPIRSMIQSPSIRSLVLVAISLGLVGLIWKYEDSTRTSHIIGDPFEAQYYEDTYEAFIYVYDKPIFCLVDMHRDGDGNYSYYMLDQVYLPYGHSCEVDDEYVPGNHNEVTIFSRYNDVDCDIVLMRPATEASQTILKNTTFSSVASGEVCTSINSDIYHYPDCPVVKRIPPDNLVYLEYEIEAYLLDLQSCEVCER